MAKAGEWKESKRAEYRAMGFTDAQIDALALKEYNDRQAKKTGVKSAPITIQNTQEGNNMANNNDTMPTSIPELEALRNSIYDQWEDAPKGLAKAKLMNQLEEIENSIEEAKRATASVNNVSGIDYNIIRNIIKEEISSINKKVEIGFNNAADEQTELKNQNSELLAELKAQKAEIASLKAEIETLKAEHSKQINSIQKQIETVQTTSDAINASVKKKSKATTATTSVTDNGDSITISVNKDGSFENRLQSFNDAYEIKRNEFIEKELAEGGFDSAVENAVASYIKTHAGSEELFKNLNISWNAMDDEGKRAFLEKIKSGEYGNDNVVYEIIKSNADKIAESVKRKMSEIEASQVDEPAEGIGMADSNDTIDKKENIFEEIIEN